MMAGKIVCGFISMMLDKLAKKNIIHDNKSSQPVEIKKLTPMHQTGVLFVFSYRTKSSVKNLVFFYL